MVNKGNGIGVTTVSIFVSGFTQVLRIGWRRTCSDFHYRTLVGRYLLLCGSYLTLPIIVWVFSWKIIVTPTLIYRGIPLPYKRIIECLKGPIKLVHFVSIVPMFNNFTTVSISKIHFILNSTFPLIVDRKNSLTSSPECWTLYRQIQEWGKVIG